MSQLRYHMPRAVSLANHRSPGRRAANGLRSTRADGYSHSRADTYAHADSNSHADTHTNAHAGGDCHSHCATGICPRAGSDSAPERARRNLI